MKNKSYVLPVLENEETGDYYIELNDDILDGTGWKTGDTLEWVDNKDGSFTLKKKDTEFVLVETIQTFRHRYMVEVPKGKAEWALDTVVLEEAKEFSQKHLGETIVSHHVMNMKEALEVCDEDNDYARTWSEEKKVNAFFTEDFREEYE